MEDKVDARLILKAASRVLEQGKQDGEGTHWHGLTVVSDVDGYNVTVSNRNVKVTVMFHSQLEIDAKNKPALDEFYDTICRVARGSGD